MPAGCDFSHTHNYAGLGEADLGAGASPVTHWRARFAPRCAPGLLSKLWVGCTRAVALVALVASGCATTAAKQDAGDLIDVSDEAGNVATLAAMKGRVVVIDLCQSSVPACNVSAKVLDEAAPAFRGQPVELVTILIDDDPMVAREAQRAYRTVLGVKHAVFLAGSHVRAGTSALGRMPLAPDAGGVPRLIILDENGAIRVDESDGVVTIQGLANRVKPLLR